MENKEQILYRLRTIRILSYWTKKEFTQCRNQSQSTAEGNHCPHTRAFGDRGLSAFQILPLREQVCVSSTKENPGWIHNSESSTQWASQCNSPAWQFLTKLRAKLSQDEFTPSIPEERCSHTPLPALHAFGTATNQVTAQQNKKLDGNKESGHFTCTLFPNKNGFFKQSCTFLPNNAS